MFLAVSFYFNALYELHIIPQPICYVNLLPCIKFFFFTLFVAHLLRMQFNYLQENVKTKHPQLLYESKLYKLLQGGSNNLFSRFSCWVLFYFFHV